MITKVARNSGRAKSLLSMVATSSRPTKGDLNSQAEKKNFMEQISAAGIASAAVVAAAAVNQAVGKSLITVVDNWLKQHYSEIFLIMAMQQA
jgi:hypothetical protein